MLYNSCVDKRFIYIFAIVAVAIGVILAINDSKQKEPSALEKLNATPSPVIGMKAEYITPAPTSAPQKIASVSAPIQTVGDLQLQDISSGSGKVASEGDKVSVNYVGYLEDGTKFDSSYDRGMPFDLQIGVSSVIEGWHLGLPGMREGGKRRLIIPSTLGYGEQGAGNGLIPPNATLIFDIELVEVK